MSDTITSALQSSTLEVRISELENIILELKAQLAQEQSQKSALQKQLFCERQALQAIDDKVGQELTIQRSQHESMQKDLAELKRGMVGLQKERDYLAQSVTRKEAELSDHEQQLEESKRECLQWTAKLTQEQVKQGRHERTDLEECLRLAAELQESSTKKRQILEEECKQDRDELLALRISCMQHEQELVSRKWKIEQLTLQEQQKALQISNMELDHERLQDRVEQARVEAAADKVELDDLQTSVRHTQREVERQTELAHKFQAEAEAKSRDLARLKLDMEQLQKEHEAELADRVAELKEVKAQPGGVKQVSAAKDQVRVFRELVLGMMKWQRESSKHGAQAMLYEDVIEAMKCICSTTGDDAILYYANSEPLNLLAGVRIGAICSRRASIECERDGQGSLCLRNACMMTPHEGLFVSEGWQDLMANLIYRLAAKIVSSVEEDLRIIEDAANRSAWSHSLRRTGHEVKLSPPVELESAENFESNEGRLYAWVKLVVNDLRYQCRFSKESWLHFGASKTLHVDLWVSEMVVISDLEHVKINFLRCPCD